MFPAAGLDLAADVLQHGKLASDNVHNFSVITTTETLCVAQTSQSGSATVNTAIAQFAITINSNVCPHIRVPNMLMRDPTRDVIGIFNSKARY